MKKVLILGFVAVAFVLSCCCKKEETIIYKAKETPDLLAQIDGKPLYEKDLDMRSQTRLYETKKQMVEGYIKNKLFDAYLSERGYTRQDFYEKEIQGKMKEPSEKEIRKFYNDRGLKQDYEKIKPQIANAIKSQKMRERQTKFFDGLMAGKTIVYYFTPPRAKVVMYDEEISRGPKNAPITLLDYDDFQCPFCKRVRPVIDQIFDKYKGKIRHVFRHFPLPMHKEARNAANASYCANEQGKFWEYRDKLFEHTKDINGQTMTRWAEELKLDMDKFKKCYESKKYDKLIQRDMDSGRDYGVTATPSFFVNGVPVMGAQPYSEFEKVIEDELKALKK